MRNYFLFFILAIISLPIYSQNYSGCEWIQCKYCKVKILRRAYNWNQNSCSEYDENGRRTEHGWIGLGAYDTECNAQSLKADKEWDAKKEKVKNGQTVIEWHKNAKAYITQSGNNYYQYDEDGVMNRKLENGLLTIFKDGKTIIGNGVKVDYYGGVRLAKNGEWMEDGYKVIYKNGYVEYDEREEKEKIEKLKIENMQSEITDCGNIECLQLIRKKYPNQVGTYAFIEAEKRAYLNDILTYPSIEKLVSYEKLLQTSEEYSNKIKTLDKSLKTSPLTEGNFEFNLHSYSPIEKAVQATLIYTLAQNNIPIDKNKCKYEENYINRILINQEKSQLTINTDNSELIWYEGDKFSTLKIIFDNGILGKEKKFFLFKGDEQICSCEYDDNNMKREISLDWKEVDNLKSDEDILCFLRKSQYVNSYLSLELFLGFQLPLTKLKNADYKRFLVNRNTSISLSTLKRHENNQNKAFVCLTLAYLYWNTEDYETSLKYFKIIKDEKLPIIFQQYDSYYANGNPVFEMSNLNQWIKKIHLVYFTNNGIRLPNEEEMLNKIKNL